MIYEKKYQKYDIYVRAISYIYNLNSFSLSLFLSCSLKNKYLWKH